MGEHATPTPAPSLCRVCSYDLSGSPTSLCPECGTASSGWMHRWRPWSLCAGLNLLVWGIPLLLLGVLLVSLYLSHERTMQIRILHRVTYAACVIPLMFCFAGGVFVHASDSRGRMGTVPLALALITIAAGLSSIETGAERLWLSIDSTRGLRLSHWIHSTIATALSLLGAAAFCVLLSRTLVRLAREFGMQSLGKLAICGALLLLATPLFVIGADLWIARTAVPPPASLASRAVWAERLDSYAYIAPMLGISLLWGSVVAIRSRVRWELRKV